VIRETSDVVSQRLDDNFIRVSCERLTPREKTYLRAMAEPGPGPRMRLGPTSRSRP
jgi:hypothetical protein